MLQDEPARLYYNDRMRTLVVNMLLGLSVMLGACGGGSEAGEALLSGSVIGNYAGESFAPGFGFATIYEENPVIFLSDRAVNCGLTTSENPPPGMSAAIWPPSLEVGTYSSIMVELYNARGGFESFGANKGTVQLTAVTATSVAGSVQYGYTSSEDQRYELAGDFEVARCPG
jgi:hypothetical protein